MARATYPVSIDMMPREATIRWPLAEGATGQITVALEDNGTKRQVAGTLPDAIREAIEQWLESELQVSRKDVLR